MEKFYYRLFILSWHYLTAFAYCADTVYITEEILYNRCPPENYYCDNNYEEGTEVNFFTCTFTKILEIEGTLIDIEVNRRLSYIVVKKSVIQTLISAEYSHSWNNVVKLQMEETYTNEISPSFFGNFHDLRELWITKNKIKTISNSMFSPLLKKLYTLNLTENIIETVAQDSFSGLINLRILDLSKNKITTLPEGVFNYQKYLLYVDISNNMLKSVGSIFNGHSLKTINVSHNFLNEFDFNQLQSSDNITKIDLSDNMIDNVTDFSNTFYIEDISLAYNKISILPKLSNIKNLNISHNRIHSINRRESSDILQSLDLNGNNISALTDHVFANLTNLEYLYFGHNNLTSLPIDALHNLHNLKHLDLSFNQIRHIPVGFFNNLNELTYLDLSDNNMILDFNVLSTLKSLQTIKFRNNKVQNFDSDIILSRFQFLKSITLSGDSWNCTELASFIRKLFWKNISLNTGQNRNVYNILGTSCKNNIDLKEDTIKIARNNAATKDVAFYSAVEKLDNILSNTSFFKSIQTIAKHISDNKSLDFSQNENVTHMREILNNTHFKNMESKSSISDKQEETRASNYGVILTNILLAMILCCLIFSAYRKFLKEKLLKSSTQEQVQLM